MRLILYIVTFLSFQEFYAQTDLTVLKGKKLNCEYFSIDSLVYIDKSIPENSFSIRIPKKIIKDFIRGESGLNYGNRELKCSFFCFISINRDTLFLSTRMHESFDWCIGDEKNTEFTKNIQRYFGIRFNEPYRIENGKIYIRANRLKLVFRIED